MQNSHHQLSRAISQDLDPSLVIEEISSTESLTTTTEDLPEARKDLGTIGISLQTKDIRAKHHRGTLLTIPDRRQDHHQQIEVVTVHEALHTHVQVQGVLHIVAGEDPMTHNTSHYRLIHLSQKARGEMRLSRFLVCTGARVLEQLQVFRSITSFLGKEVRDMQTGRHVDTASDVTAPSIEQETAQPTERAVRHPVRCVCTSGTHHTDV